MGSSSSQAEEGGKVWSETIFAPAIIAKCMVHRIPTLMYEDKTEFLIIGRRTKWKLKARSEIIKEHKRAISEMWHKTNDRIISW